MERPLWDRIQELYHSTLPLPRSDRSAFLTTVCRDDPVLVREVNSLLEADDTAQGFLESSVFELGLRVISSSSRNQSNGHGLVPGKSLDGTTIEGRFLVEKELGHGGMGKVYLARDATLHHRRVVIKVLLQASLEDPYVVKKFQQEVEALSRIDHPNIVSVLGAGKLPSREPYIVMQYVDGVTLRSQILPEGMDLERVALILKQLGAALDDVHEQGIFHRDLKPENILLQVFRGNTELVKVVDFGIAKVKDSVVAPSTVNNAPVGTFLYMSPEQLRGGEKITAMSDVYSMAIIAYEMITGRRPFNPSSAPQLLEMHREGVRVNPIDLRPILATEARAILLRALSFEPANRYQSAAEFGDRLAHALTVGHDTIRVSPAYPVVRETVQPQGEIPTPAIPTLPNVVAPWLGGRLKFVLGSFLIAIIGISLAIYVSNWRRTATDNRVVDPLPSPSPLQKSDSLRTFNYWLNVQKIRNGKPFQQAFLSSGNEIYETGYKFRLNVTSPDAGYLYLFNEGPPSQSETSFTILYPTPRTNGGSATLGPNQLFQTSWNTFAGPTGTENFWIVWSVSPVPELEAAKTEAFKHPNGALIGENLVVTKKLLMTKEKETRYATNKETHQTTVRGPGDLLVRRVEFQHR